MANSVTGARSRSWARPHRTSSPTCGDPRLEQVGRGDVVVVHELPLGPVAEDVGHPAADGQLVEQHPPGARPVADAGDREALVEPVGRGVAVVDVRPVPTGPEQVPELHHVAADGVPAGQRRDDLVDPGDGVTPSTPPSRAGRAARTRRCRRRAPHRSGRGHRSRKLMSGRQAHPAGRPTGVGHLELGDLVLPVEDGRLGGAADADAHRVRAVEQRDLGEVEPHDAAALGDLDGAHRVVGVGGEDQLVAGRRGWRWWPWRWAPAPGCRGRR